MKTINRSSVSAAAIMLGVVGIAVGGAMLLANFARADVGPTVGVTVRNSGSVVVTSAPIGSILSASTTVATSSVSVPTGTVNFQLYQNLSCTGASTTQANVPLVNGSAVSATTTMGASGLSYIVHYNGDATSTPANSQCVAVTPTLATAIVSTVLSTTTMLAGLTAYDTATLTNVTSNASGTVSYVIYTNTACTLGAQSAGVKSVVNGIVPNSDPMLFMGASTYYWQVVYSGDLNNAAATSTCTNEILTVSATSTPPVVVPPTPTPGTGTISGVVFNDLNRNRVLTVGEPGIAGYVIKLHLGGKNKSPVVATTTTDVSGAYSFANLAFGTYYVEEVTQAEWKQTTNDQKVKLGSTTVLRVVNFANEARKVKTPKGNGHDNGRELNHGQQVKALVHEAKDEKEKKDKENEGKGSGKNNKHD